MKKDLYNKLWENINHKENRVWTFVSLYGGGLAFFMGSGALSDGRRLGLPILVIIGFWVIRLVLEGDWWNARNRLMVQQIEKADDELKKLIPSNYMNPRYAMDDVFKVSLIVLFTLNLVLMCFSLLYFMEKEVLKAMLSASPLLSDYLKQFIASNAWVFLTWFYALLLMNCIDVREHIVNKYWRLAIKYETDSAKVGDTNDISTLKASWKKEIGVHLTLRHTIFALVLFVAAFGGILTIDAAAPFNFYLIANLLLIIVFYVLMSFDTLNWTPIETEESCEPIGVMPCVVCSMEILGKYFVLRNLLFIFILVLPFASR